MGKIEKKRHSLKWSIAPYLPFCLIAAYLGTMTIAVGTNYLQDWYMGRHLNSFNMGYFIVYWIISYAQMILIPAWVIFCIVVPGIIFYNWELKKPIDILLDASRKIADNELDFKVEYKKQNELGMLCTAFDDMRSALYENNLEMWRSLEERKRLNSAFSHDLRTPLTVLRGYTDFLEKYIPDGKVTQEKLLSVISMMNGQISRLEHYAQKMNAVQKLEDIVPNIHNIPEEELFSILSETGKMIVGDKFRLDGAPDHRNISIDTELVIQVYENLISNAVRYTENTVTVNCGIAENILTISVLDDGKGFTEEALKNAAQPFFRDGKEPDKTHFGLGLYISRILCEKCGRTLTMENHENGGKVTAKFFCG
ncbi:MAG: HAMP domain-containing histidine kinase [Acetatifactor sp.]|nr:HAMP domain-containing histidine kinase [Acetatifactor sp.]